MVAEVVERKIEALPRRGVGCSDRDHGKILCGFDNLPEDNKTRETGGITLLHCIVSQIFNSLLIFNSQVCPD